MDETRAAWMAYGIDIETAEQRSKTSIQQLKGQSAEILHALNLSENVGKRLLRTARIPILQKITEAVLTKSACACCAGRLGCDLVIVPLVGRFVLLRMAVGALVPVVP